MKKISIQSLNSLFNFMRELPSIVFWIRDTSFTKQIYVSSNYETLWEHSSEKLYEHPESFSDTIISSDKKAYINSVDNQIHANDKNENTNENIYLYRVITRKSKLIYIRDKHYLLVSNENIPLGYVGFAKKISEEEWKESNNSQSEDKKFNHIEKNVFSILQKELQLKCNAASSSHNQPNSVNKLIKLAAERRSAKLTPQEITCFSYILNGISTKQTASLMNISTRTVEFHLENLRNKFKCRTKIQLISSILIDS